jgi:hypothetical protein
MGPNGYEMEDSERLELRLRVQPATICSRLNSESGKV